MPAITFAADDAAAALRLARHHAAALRIQIARVAGASARSEASADVLCGVVDYVQETFDRLAPLFALTPHALGRAADEIMRASGSDGAAVASDLLALHAAGQAVDAAWTAEGAAMQPFYRYGAAGHHEWATIPLAGAPQTVAALAALDAAVD